MVKKAKLLEVVVFMLGPDRYAIEVEAVERVVEIGAAIAEGDGDADEPEAAPIERCNAAELLGLPGADGVELRRELLLNRGQRRRVLLVGEVLGIRTVEPDVLLRVPEWYPERTAALVRGIARVEEGLIVVLEGAKVVGG